MNNFSTYWDEDIQQRAVEYEMILKQSETDPNIKNIFDNAFDELPTFPDSKQTNSVLMRRMGEIKQKKGFEMTKGEENKGQGDATQNFKQGVSSALSKNQRTEEQPSVSASGIDMDDTSDSLLDMDGPVGQISGDSIDHEFS